MSSLFDNLNLDNKKYKYTLTQTLKNKFPINILSTAFNRTLDSSISETDVLKFSIPLYIEDIYTHEKIENPQYSSILTENLILLKIGEPTNPLSQSYYIIKNLSESTDTLSLDVECKDRSFSLDSDNITISGSGIERELITTVDINNVVITDIDKLGVLNLIEAQTTWKVGYIDPTCLIDVLDTDSSVPRVRWIDAISKPILQFLNDDIATAYNLIINYDSFNKLINIYNKDSYGQNTGIILSEQNYMKSLVKSTKGDAVYTRLNVSGKDILISDLTLDGTNYVTNYDYYKKSGQMSAELILALEYFDELLAVKDVEFKLLKKKLDELNATIVIKTSELGLLTEGQKVLDGIQASYAINKDALNLPNATKNCSDNITAVADKNGEIALLNTQVISINLQITQISIDINKKTACIVNSKILIFTDNLIEELEDWTLTQDWSSDVYTTPELLKKASEEALAKNNIPIIEFQISMIDLFALMEAQHIWGKIKLGDLVRIYSPKLKVNIDLRIVSYSYNIDTNALNIVFSNKDNKLDKTVGIGSKITQAVNASKYVNAKKIEWNTIKDTKNSVDTFLNSNFDVALQQIQALSSRNKISMTENGIIISDAVNPDDLLYLTAGQIIVSDDNLKTAKVAINSSGINSEVITGRLLISKELYVENTAGNLSFTENGFELKDDKYKLLLSGKGIISHDNFGFPEQVDKDHPYVINFNVNENVNVISEVLLKLTVEPYRATESSVLVGDSGGTGVITGGATSTSLAGGHKTKLFSYDSDVTSGGDTPYTTYLQYMAKSSNNGNIPFVFKTTSGSSANQDIYAEETPNHVHNIASSTYTTSARQLDGSLVYGIWEKPITLESMPITIDGVVRATATPSVQQIVDITQFIVTKGWHCISVGASSLNRYSISISMKSYIGA